MIDVEPLIEASFDRMLPQPIVTPAWRDVLERVGTRQTRSRAFAGLRATRRRYVVAVFAVLALVVVVGAAYAFGHPIVRFSSAPKASSRTVVNHFGQWTVLAVPTPVRPHQARLITTVRLDGRDIPLFVAPVRGGGFCYLWKGSFDSCASGQPSIFVGVQAAATTRYQGREYMSVINGLVPQARAAHVVLHYADGQSADIPFVWVTAPIKSGFFLYGIPQAHQRPGHQPVRISLTNSAGAVIASQRVLGSSPIYKAPPPPYRLVPHEIADYPQMMVPTPADWAKRQQLFSLRAPTGTRVGLWIAPAPGGSTCYWSNVHAGCGKLLAGTSGGPQLHANPTVSGAYNVTSTPTPHYWLKVMRGHDYVALCCTLDPRAHRVQLRFQDGHHITLTPRHGYLIWPIPRSHYPPGHRLEEVDFYGAHGRQIGATNFEPAVRALYPCAKPKNYGYGLKMCP